MHVGVDPADEAGRVVRTLEAAGYQVTERTDAREFVALVLERADGRRAVRVISSRGVVVALDSHEPDGVRLRHGNVGLIHFDADRGHDVDGDGRPELVLTSGDDEPPCMTIVRIGADGRAMIASVQAEVLAPGACPTGLEDVDGDGVREVLVELRWPQLSLDEQVPAVRAPLLYEEGAWRAAGMPPVYEQRERAWREAALEEARRAPDVPRSLRLAVELAALAHLSEAPLAAQVERFDRALDELTLTAAQAESVARIRDVIRRGWRATEP